MEACTNSEILKAIYFFILIVRIIKIIVPIGLIVFGMFDFSKGLINGDGKNSNHATAFIKRIVYAILIFLVPWIVRVFIVWLGNLSEGVNFTDCIENATPEMIKELEDNNFDNNEIIDNQSDDNPSVVSELSTGYLKSPLDVSASQKDFIKSIGDNSKRITYLNGNYHGGTDLPVVKGTPVYAMDGGSVFKVQDGCGSYGRHIILKHFVDGKTYYTIYAHLDSIEGKYKSEGTIVNQGELIGHSGNTYHCGETVAEHLHIGIALENNKNSKFPQQSGDNSFLVGNFIGTNNKYSVVDSSNLKYYKECHYCS